MILRYRSISEKRAQIWGIAPEKNNTNRESKMNRTKSAILIIVLFLMALVVLTIVGICTLSKKLVLAFICGEFDILPHRGYNLEFQDFAYGDDYVQQVGHFYRRQHACSSAAGTNTVGSPASMSSPLHAHSALAHCNNEVRTRWKADSTRVHA